MCVFAKCLQIAAQGILKPNAISQSNHSGRSKEVEVLQLMWHVLDASACVLANVYAGPAEAKTYL